MLSSADALQLGYVTRTAMRSPLGHTVLGVQSYNLKEFAQQTQFK